jgi:KEOPS complex subunit Cgi121
MEALLFAAGSRQCNIAASLGIHDGENHLWISCYPVRQGVWALLSSLVSLADKEWEPFPPGKKERLMDLFSITEDEIRTLGRSGSFIDLVLERVALLEVLR